MDAPWTRTGEEVLQYYAVDATRGLTSEAAAKHAELYGKNGALNRYCVLSSTTYARDYQSYRKTLQPLYGN